VSASSLVMSPRDLVELPPGIKASARWPIFRLWLHVLANALLTCCTVMSVRARVASGYLLMLVMGVTIGLSTNGCSGACAQAEDLCETCEVPEFAKCNRFDDLTTEQCEAEITVYEANCPDA
jgi:hypothetical protein